jgi:hypothetical protein
MCLAGASCENTGIIPGNFPIPNIKFMSIVAEDQAIVKADMEQESFQENVCERAIAICINSGVDFVDILASDQASIDADSQQVLEQRNECQNFNLCE